MYSSTSTIILNMHEYEYSEKNVLEDEYEYDYFSMYSSTMTLECNHDYFHDYFNECPVSTVKATSVESCVILFLLLCQYLVF